MKIVMRSKNREQLRADAIAQLLAEQPQASNKNGASVSDNTEAPTHKIRVVYKDPSMTGQAQRTLAKMPATHRNKFAVGTPLPVGEPEQTDMQRQANATLANVPSAWE